MKQMLHSPCGWMKPLLNMMVEGRLKGFMLWFAELHKSQCPQCTAAHRALLATRDSLRRVGLEEMSDLSLGTERWANIESACRASELEDDLQK